MKNIFKFFGVFLAALFTLASTGCVEEELGSADVGLHIKVFFPTKVVESQPVTINGSGFSDATEIVFPGDVVVTDFEIVSNDMIRVNTPAGVAAEGGHIVVRTETEEVESPLPLTVGNTVIKGCSTPEDGSAVQGGSQMTIYGTDLEFVKKIELVDEDGNPIFVEDKTFIRKGSSTIIFTVPRKVFEGEIALKIYTFDDRIINHELPVLLYEPASDGGHWETLEHILWENPDPAGIGSVSWSGQYRFGLEGTDGNKECVATFPADQWEIIKNGTFCLTYEAPGAYQVRATTGWWSFDGDGVHDIHENDERVVDNGDGTYTLVYTLSEEPLKSGIYDLIDSQHLLFTGSGFTPLKIFYTEDVWVGGTIEIVRTSIWKNDGSVAAATWSGSPYRFGLDGRDGNKECVATVDAETWEKMKTTPFKVDFAATGDWFQIRILDGWWSVGNNDANDITPSYEGLVDNGDGTFTFVVDISGNADLLAVLDDQHLLFAGDGFTILEMYWEEEVLVPGGGGPKEVVLWEGEAIADDWGNQPTILSDAGLELVDAGATAGQTLYFYFEPLEEAWQVKIVEGHWGPTYAAICSEGNDNGGEFTVYDLAGNDGKFGLELTQEILDAALTQQWWGGAFLLNGDNIKCTKVTLL